MSEKFPIRINEEWLELYDKNTNKVYYANTKLKITQWNKPEITSNNSNNNADRVQEEINKTTAVGNTENISPIKEKDIINTNITLPSPLPVPITNTPIISSPSSSLSGISTTIPNTIAPVKLFKEDNSDNCQNNNVSSQNNTITNNNNNNCNINNIQKPITFLHMSDPFSLKLFIWLKETNYINNIDLRIVSDDTQSTFTTEFENIQKEIQNNNNNNNNNIQRELSYPTTIYHTGEIISGADYNIHTFISHFSNENNEINWNSLSLFNFYSCGLLLEHSAQLKDDTKSLTNGKNKSNYDNVNSVYNTEEYLTLHQENIRLQLYLSSSEIQQFRSEQSYRVENQRLRDEIEKLSSRLIELTHKLTIEKQVNYNKINDNKKLHEINNKLEDEKANLINLLTDQIKLTNEKQKKYNTNKMKLNNKLNRIYNTLFHEVHSNPINEDNSNNNNNNTNNNQLTYQRVNERTPQKSNDNNKNNNDVDIDDDENEVKFEEMCSKSCERIEEYQKISKLQSHEIYQLKDSLKKLQLQFNKAESELQRFQQIIRE